MDKVLKWFEEQPQADAEENEAKQKELEVGSIPLRSYIAYNYVIIYIYKFKGDLGVKVSLRSNSH